MKKNRWILMGIILLIVIGVFLFFFFNKIKPEKFEYDSVFLKIAIAKGEATANNIKITNINSDSNEFSVKINNIEDLVNIEESSFSLMHGESHIVKILSNAKDKNNFQDPGVYLGELEISSGGIIKKIPILIELQSKNVLFDSNINLFPPGDIVSGQRLNAEIKVFDLTNLGRSNVKLTYFIKDFTGRIIISESENLVVDRERGYPPQIFKTLTLPENIRLGDYVLGVIVQYSDTVGVSSVYFKIVDKKSETTSSNSSAIFIIVAIIFFFLIFLGLFVYFLFYRDRLLMELQSQYRTEVKNQKEVIHEKQREDYIRLKTIAEKREYNRELEQAKRKRIEALKEIQKKRLKEFKKIKKTGKKSKLEKQIKKWKSQGYDTQVLEKHFKLPNVSNIKKKIRQWKTKGYDTRVLER